VLPTRIEAEDYDLGGEGVAYHDTDATNNGNRYRLDEAVDIQDCSDEGGGYNLGWIYDVEWIEYTIEVPETGRYPIDIRVASPSVGGAFHLEFDGVDRTGEITVPVTGSWQTWTTVSATAMLPAGVQTMRFVPTVQGFNLNAFEFLAPTSTPDVVRAQPVLYPNHPNPFNPATTISFALPRAVAVDLAVYNVAGKLVRRLIAGDVVAAGRHEVHWNGRDEAGRAVPAGVYLYRLTADGYSEARRMALVK
jgi:hypothetical protein